MFSLFAVSSKNTWSIEEFSRNSFYKISVDISIYIRGANKSWRKVNRANRARRNVHRGNNQMQYLCVRIIARANSTYLITHARDNRTIPISRESCHRFQGEGASRSDERDRVVLEVHVRCQTGCCRSAARWITAENFISFNLIIFIYLHLFFEFASWFARTKPQDEGLSLKTQCI